jgi:RNA polymerase sigma-70 factor (ECF subfamily)
VVQVCYPQVVVERRASDLPRAAIEHLDALYGFALRLTGRAAEAEDLVQETYARALAAQAQFEVGSNLRAWLFRILRNVHIDARRRAQRSPVKPGAPLDDTTPAVDPAAREALRGDEELELLRGIVAGDIEAALASLSEDARTVVLLEQEGLSEAELASVLGCAPGTVKSRLARARAALRDKLREYAR